MFSRPPVRSGVFNRRFTRPISWAMAGVMGASFIQLATNPASAEPKSNRPSTSDSSKVLPKRDPLPVKPRKSNPVLAAATAGPAKVSWPAAGAADVSVPSPSTARSAASTATAKIGGLPVSVSAVPAETKASPGRTSPAATGDPRPATDPAPGKVRVEVLAREVSQRANVEGPVVRLTRNDGRSAAGKVRLGLGYEGIASAYGGDFGARLRLVRLPECALTTPHRADCAGVPVPTTNDGESKTVSAEASTGALFAMTATDASSQGDYGATGLSPSSKWSVAPSTGGFSWSYPLRTPPVPGGNAPGITLGYSSQSIDGRTATTNNQGSWIGEGFNYEPGHIERRYKPCAEDGHDQYADQCWAFDNATILLNGRSTELVKSGSTWRFATDDGSKVERLSGAVNGDNDGEYWRVTTTNGTEYYFGMNRLPGWTSGKEETKSAWTLPIYGDDSGEPCYNATFTSAYCDQAWRWSLDYVKDRYGNVTSYYYNQEINHYARGKKTDVNGVPYVRGGSLKRVDYGQRHNAVYTTNAPARVVFATKERCLPSGSVDCDPQDLTAATAPHWPDVPFDRNCAANTKCKLDQLSPTFWTRVRLTGITTEIREGTGWTPVDTWKLDHLFTDNSDGSRTLWLHKITHTGSYGPGADIAMPSVELGPLQLPNRIDRDGDFIAPLVRVRLTTVWNDSGGQIDVTYAAPDCTQTTLPTPGNSTRRCFPVKWNPLGSGDPITDWFHKYVVEEVVETDRTGGAPDMVTRYQYQGGAAWRHADPDGISKPEDLTWSDWRGYGNVVVTAGERDAQTTKTAYRYLRGMHGDKDPDGGTRTVTVDDSTGGTHTDHPEFSGHQLESVVYDGANEVSKSIAIPWRHNTATQTFSWGSRKAWFVNTTTARSLVALAAGGWRETKQTSVFETSFGRVTETENEGDVNVAGDESCSRTTYADNATGHLYSLVSRVESVSVKCSVTPDRSTQVISDTRTLYDGNAFGVAPTLGNPTRSERLKSHNGTTATYIRASGGTFDSYGRPLTAVDSLGNLTKTEYTDTNGLTTKVNQTSPLLHVTTTDYAPAWGVPVSQVDPNGLKSILEYDPLGRLTKVWLPDRTGTAGLDPSIRYTYLVRTDKPVTIKTEKRQNDGSYNVEYKLHDGLLRPRQVQSEGPDGTRTVADTFYTATGSLAKTYATYTVAGAPSDLIYPAVNGDVNGQTLYVHDGADRVTAEIFAVAGIEKWRTTTTYGGDRISIDPPAGGTPTTSITNALGQTTELLQYKGAGPTGVFDKTEYTYTHAGKLKTVKDPAGNVWSHEYDQLGRKTKSIDPDAGTSTTAYDDLDRVVSTTNGVNQTVSSTYDAIGRKTAVYKGAADTGTLLSSWTYDLEMVGHLSATSRWVDGAEYATYYSNYDEFYRPHATHIQVPDHAGAELAGMYVFGAEYNRDGTVQSMSMSDGGGLPFETIAYTYDGLERLTATTGDNAYLTDIEYASTGEVLQTEAQVGTRKVWSTYEYEQGSKRLTRQRLDRESAPIVDIDARYTYDASGNIQRIVNNPSGTQDTQCFTYDYLRRMDRAWTSASTATDPCAGGPSVTGVGGIAPYHHAYTFDATGNRKTEAQYAANGTPLIERSYTYPAAGQAQPHTLSQMTESTPAGDRLYSYQYDAAGNTTKRTRTGEDQTLVWDAEGNLESVTDAAGKKTSFTYDVDGSRMLRKEPNATTLYLPGMEIRLNHQTRVTDATRYYGLPGGGTLVRKTDGIRYVASDHHGTGQATVDGAGAITHRRTTPFGESRGTAPAPGQWPTEKGFVNGNIDSTTGLVNIGAREYDAIAGRFISVDPIIDVNDPQQMNGYAYANNNPISYSDPDGLKACSDDACGPGADYEDMYGNYHKVKGHNDGCGGCSGAYDPDEPTKNVHNNPRASAEERAAAARAAAEKERQRRIAEAKARMLNIAKALGKIAMEELGITDALDCFLKGDMDGCIATAVNVVSSAFGGALGKLAARYGAPWKWEKAAALASRVKGLLVDLVDKAKAFISCKNSFVPGTLVVMADGSRKPIEDVKTGDVVLVTDPVTGKTTTKPVVATIIGQGAKNLVEVTIDPDGDSGDATESVVATDNHPFWVPRLDEWVDAADLQAGQWLRTSAGTHVQISAIRQWTEPAQVHNLTIDDIHTYYVVAGDTPVLVHNCGETFIENAAGDRLYGPYHRLKSPTQGDDVAAQMSEGGELWGNVSRVSFQDRPMVQAYRGALPAGKRGVEFYTPVKPLSPRNSPPGEARWVAGMPGVRVEDDYAKIKIIVTRNTQG
ncbi:polymorphic toxin-type HINT domain-containing protein [Micromonospora sp. DSM 115977]|uniref:Polymorphic toxin-type HINT domain-containing protein n=1 Tax=Micromonospora reichwaldensis TaxID=3075516 RepID=A0ABU2WXW6_9ACTN|nr:polymorphic toxin-type HINT domain-containing protein [Micromonospora sp. DSM 115977]MDT0530454.1 polymorphic toxin-type HINT domain-containing protein [Micromonospora sp. DSM 115977]